MAHQSPPGQAEPFVHELAISISREINLINPNDTLAQRMIQLAKENKSSLPAFSKAASAFGRFRPAFIEETFKSILSHDFGVGTLPDADAGKALKDGQSMVGNLVVHDTDVMQPQAPQRGGLALGSGGPRHVFKANPTAKASTLGLDRLAMEKRKEREVQERQSKKIKTDEEDDEGEFEFKGEPLPFHCFQGWLETEARSTLSQAPTESHPTAARRDSIARSRSLCCCAKEAR
jgi:pre-mRNA-splicing factor ATP-dependent RNA helicase DHX38/PRP16